MKIKKMCSFVAFTLDQFAGAFNHRIFESRNSRLIIILCTSLTVHEKTHPSVSPFDSHTNTRRRLFFVQFRRNPLLNLTLEKSHSFPHSKKISDDKPKNSRHTQTQLFCKRNWADEIFPAESLFFVRLAHANISKMYNLIHNRRKAIVLFIIVTSLISTQRFLSPKSLPIFQPYVSFCCDCYFLSSLMKTKQESWMLLP